MIHSLGLQSASIALGERLEVISLRRKCECGLKS